MAHTLETVAVTAVLANFVIQLAEVVVGQEVTLVMVVAVIVPHPLVVVAVEVLVALVTLLAQAVVVWDFMVKARVEDWGLAALVVLMVLLVHALVAREVCTAEAEAAVALMLVLQVVVAAEVQFVLSGPGIHAHSHQPMLALMSHQHRQLVQ